MDLLFQYNSVYVSKLIQLILMNERAKNIYQRSFIIQILQPAWPLFPKGADK